jgi:hypothetical protein
MINIIAIIIGIICGCVLFCFYQNSAHIKYHGPDSSIVKKTIYIDSKNKKKYMFEPKVYLCPIF